MSGDGAAQQVAVCVLTYHRTVGLARLLGHLRNLEVPEGVAMRVVVVDNDAEGSARPVVERVRAGGGLDITYVVEERRGIARARNRAVAEAKPCDLIAFIDDDDWPEPDWLARLLAHKARCGAAAVLGPLDPVFEEPPPAWIERGRFFGSLHHRTGTELRHWQVRTGGVLVDASIIEAAGPEPFDVRFDLHGGEDTALFFDLLEQGHRVVWVEEAVIHEVVPPTKARLRWLLLRAFRIGNSKGTHFRYLPVPRWRLAKRSLRSAYNGGRAIAHLLTARSAPDAVRALQLGVDAVGEVLGLLGYRYQEYRRTHGR